MRVPPTLLLSLTLVMSASVSAEQSATPKLSKPQREALQTVVAAVDAASQQPATSGLEWQTHVLRTSDGSHYVAFSVAPPLDATPPPGTTFYVRLATRNSGTTVYAERSAVMEWLKGMRSDPLVAQKQRGIAFGEMPVFGPAGISTRGAAQQTTDLNLLALERNRARERKEAAERARRAALEGTAERPRDTLYPFEDFSLPIADLTKQTATAVQRSITAGPGEYDLYVAWALPPVKGRAAAVHVLKRPLSLPPATFDELTLSSVILVDSVGTRKEPYPPDQQSSHPYSIGPMEIVPAADEVFTNDERLAIVVQVLNAQPTNTGKPDLGVGFQLFRTVAGGEQSVGLLNPQFYNSSTLPPDFDLSKGHPIFAAMAAPLKTLPRGQYRLKIVATDKVTGRSAPADVLFRIVATATTLLATAPATVPFRREALLESPVLNAVAAALGREKLTPVMAGAIEALTERRFLDLLREDVVDDSERRARAALRALGLFAIGDPRMSCTILRQEASSVDSGALRLYLGGCRASEGNDLDAIAEWETARTHGVGETLATPLIVDAHLRLGNAAAALAQAARLTLGDQPDPAIARAVASIHVAQGREPEAVRIIERHLAVNKDDADAQYVLLHALFAGLVHQRGAGSTPEGKARFVELARNYIAAKNRHAALVAEWLDVLPQ